MKNWLTIGQFAKATGLTVKALRIYESRGLLVSHARGENSYRYYEAAQISVAQKIMSYKKLGFTLLEIESLLHSNVSDLKSFLLRRLSAIQGESRRLERQTCEIKSILSSLETTKPLREEERIYVMSLIENLSIVITGIKGLERTAELVRKNLHRYGHECTVRVWDGLPRERAGITILHERDLSGPEVRSLKPHVIVIKDISEYSEKIERDYLNLYADAGPYFTTIFNADDRTSVALAGNEAIKKGRIYYYSKNSGLEDQIRRIGGAVSDGEKIKIFHGKDKGEIQLDRYMSFDDEIALLSSLAAVINIDKAGTPEL